MATIRLSDSDNIVVLSRSLPAGSVVEIDGREYRLLSDVGLGHKLAAKDIRRAEKILKYGAPIGSATCDIAAGTHVHLHNMKSDYLPTFTLDEERLFRGAQ